MKVWFGHGSEHSMNLVMIGEFKTEEDAARVHRVLGALAQQAQDDESAGLLDPMKPPSRFTEGMLDLLGQENVSILSAVDPIQFLFTYDVRRDGNRLVLTTDEPDVGAFLKLFLDGQAKVNVFSAHDYPGGDGR